jgi:hypothetical protein
MLYVDVAAAPNNPFPGRLNHADVTPGNLVSVLTGEGAAVPKGKPVLRSTAEDDVF